MSEIRIPGFASGSDLGGEPQSFLVYDTETKKRRIEMNPNYVPPPPPTLIQRLEWAVRDAEGEVERARFALELAKRELAAVVAEESL